MLQTVRITSKRQITIPAAIFNQLSLNEGDRLIVEVEANKILMQKSQLLLDELAGSLKLPKKYKNRSLDYIIKKSKEEYFKKKK